MIMQKRGTLWMAALLALLALLALAALAPDAALAEAVKINETNFPDDNFRDYVLTEIDTSGDGSLSDTEIATVTMINVSSEGITDLTGIKHFTALTDLYCSSNQLTTLDVSGNTQLTSLDCSSNQLTALDVSKNTNLTALDCSSNNLTKLDVSGCTALKRLFCDGNQLTELNVSSNTELTSLYCFNNNLTALDVSKNTALQRLNCSGNNLTKLDVSGCADLKTLYCSNNALTALDMSGYTNLQTLNCSNQVAELNVDRETDGSWNADLLTLIDSKISGVQLTPETQVGVTVEKNVVSWTNKDVRPVVSYNYDTGHNEETMKVTLTLIPQGIHTDTSVSKVTVDGTEGEISDTTITVKLPSGTGLPTDADQIVITPADSAVASTPIKAAGDESGKTWTFTVTAEDGQTKTYTLLVLTPHEINITLKSIDGGTDNVNLDGADSNWAWEGDTITLIPQASSDSRFVRWEVEDLTINSNQFTMPDRDVNITAVFGKNSYNVTLNLNGGTINSGNVTTYTYGEGATLPTDVTRSGYTFAGWYASAALTGSPVTAITTTDEGDKEYWAKWTENAPPAPVAPPEIDFTPGGDQPGGDEPGGDQPASVELEPGQSATLDLGVVDNYAAFAAAGVEIVATPVCDAGMTASAVVDQSGHILLNLYAIEPGEHQVSVTLSAAGCQPVTVAQITLTVPEAQPEDPEDPEDPDAPDLPDIQPQEGTQAYTGVQGVTHLSLSQGTVVFTLPDLAGTEGVVWKSSKPKVVSIDPQTGEAQLKKSGTATLTATLPDGTTITQKVNVHKKDFAQPDTIRLQTKVDGKWTDVPEEGIVVVPKKSGQKSVPTRLVGDGGEIIIESIEADKALLTRSSGNPAPVKIKKRSLTDGQTTTLIIKANGQEFTLLITIDSTAKDLYPDLLPSEIQSILQQEE